ncbi:MAG: acyltransferase [Hyphomicrobiales bacterium]|nr:acyltransferase [Hyphomicrobiales bacterium]
MSALAKYWSIVSDAPSLFRRRMTGGAYRPEIDGLRFFAIAIVVVGHVAERAVRFFASARLAAQDSVVADLVQRAGLGVFLFFTISGFIIATQARKARQSPLSGAFLRSYYGRRILRIEPPYIVLLVCTWAALTLTGYAPEGANHFDAAPQSLTVSLLASMAYLHGLVFGAYPRLFPPGWSLEVEVQFYLVAPLLFWLWFRMKRATTRVAFGLGLLAIGALASLALPDKIGAVFVDKSILRFFSFFWLGIILCDAQGWATDKIGALPAPLTTAIGWCGLAAYLVIPNAGEAVIPGLVLRAAVYLSLIAMFASAWAPRSGFRRFCSRPWIALVGGACYSIYLVHLQTAQIISTIAAKLAPGLGLAGVCGLMVIQYLAIVAAGLVFYILIERTFMLPDWHRQAAARVRALLRPRAPGATPAE